MIDEMFVLKLSGIQKNQLSQKKKKRAYKLVLGSDI